MEESIAEYVRSRKRAQNDLVLCRALFAHLRRPANAAKQLPAEAADCIMRCFADRPAVSLAQCVSACAKRQLRYMEDQVSELVSEASSGKPSVTTRTSATSVQRTWRRLRKDIIFG